jgi:hypothetical protein
MHASIRPAAIEAALTLASVSLKKTRPDYESHDPATPQDVQNWLHRLRSNAAPGRPFWSVDDRELSLLQSFLAREGDAMGGQVKETADGFEAQFDTLDPGWIWSLRNWVKGLSKHEFISAENAPSVIGNDLRIALLADWGTGLYGAPRCAQAIDRMDKLDLIMHLGDVYYAGDRGEVMERFLRFWPRRRDVTHRALNGNHEMYTGGKGYFDLILADERFKQSASYFAFVNDHWLIVGLDTAYKAHDLQGDQAAWLRSLAERYPSQRLMLFSHHQPFSAFEGQGIKLVSKLSPLLSSQRVAAWYWGHEHMCARYDEHPTWKMYGRCVGHSGFPYFRFLGRSHQNGVEWVDCPGKRNVPTCHVLDGPNPFVREAPEDYGPNGYVTLELQGRKIHERYCDPTGTVVGEYELTA